MTRRSWLAGLVLALFVLSLGGCMNGPDPEEAQAALRSTRSQVIAAVKTVGEQLAADGGTFGDASGRFSVCSSAPTTAMEYGGGGKISGDPRPVEERIASAATSLTADGWKVVSSSQTSSSARRPYTNLEKDGLHLSLNPDPLRGSDALVFSIVGDCLRVTDEQVGEHAGTDTISAED